MKCAFEQSAERRATNVSISSDQLGDSDKEVQLT